MLTPAKEAELKENLWQIAKLEKAVQQVNPHPTPYTLAKLEKVSNRSKSKQFAPATGLNPQPSTLLPPAVRERWPAVDDKSRLQTHVRDSGGGPV